MDELSAPPSDEPFDFRHQAAIYARYRRDYSPALYAAIEARTGRGGGRLAVDLGCGTGMVGATLARGGWRVLGLDFSAPMLAEARRVAPVLDLVRARGEQLPVRDGAVALFVCGTAFHWVAPAPGGAEIVRVLAPGGWAALFWRYHAPGQPYMALVVDLLRAHGVTLPSAFEQMVVHPVAPFADSELVTEPPLRLTSELVFTPDSFHGYVATLEWVRRLAGAAHAAFLSALATELHRRYPDGFRERHDEYLFLARRNRILGRGKDPSV